MEPKRYIGGQAVLEGVMMRGGSFTAVAVRKPDRSIHVECEETESWTEKFRWLALPVLRGSAVLIESLVSGMKALNKSASLSEGDEEEELSKWQMAGTLLFSLLFAVLLFILLPLYAAGWLTHGASGTFFAAVEGLLRLLLFGLYLVLISRMNDIARVFQYHGAEHKTINCHEAGERLTVANVQRHTMIHKRCGTSFLLYVVVISILLFSFFSSAAFSHVEMVLVRLLLMPVVAGLAYELIRFSGSTDNRVIRLIVWPGMLMQKLTTREPDDEMVEVAIASVKAVLEKQQGRFDFTEEVIRS